MSLASMPLPSDPAALRALAAGLQAELARKELEIAANAAEIHAKTVHIEKLKIQLAVLRRARFGRSSEKLDTEIEQLELLIGELETDQAEAESRAAADPVRRDPAKARPRQPAVRRPLPAHLPRETVTHAPPCACPLRWRSHRVLRTRIARRWLRRHRVQPHRPGRARGAGIRSLQLQSDPACPAEAELPGVRDHRAAAHALPADRAGPAGAGPGGGCADVEILRSH